MNIINPLVSVIIPVYNVKPYLREAIDSVIGQTYARIEIIIIDDGSTDGSEMICDEFTSDSRVTVIHQKNGGLSNARNAGLDIINGAYICFLDPDDAYHPTFIEKMVNEAEKTQAEIVVCNYTLRKTIEQLIPKEEYFKPIMSLYASVLYNRDDALRSMVKGELGVSAWNKLYKEEVWSNIRFPNGRNHEDIDTMYFIVDSCQTVSVIHETLYFKREREGSITHDYSANNARDLMLACANLEAFILAHYPEIFDDSLVGQYKQWHLNVCMGFFAKCSGDSNLSNNIREQILEKGKEIKHWNVRTRVAYFMVRYFPLLFKYTYKIYRPCRLFVRKVTGR